MFVVKCEKIRRKKVFIPQNMTTKEIKEKYNISKSYTLNTKKRGWFIKNYGRDSFISLYNHKLALRDNRIMIP